MGMYDDIKCEVPLPDDYTPKDGVFQTKDFDCELTTYTITKDGRLVSDDWHYEDVPPAERPHPDSDGLLGLIGSIRKVVDRPSVDRNFHGTFRFYDYEGNPNSRKPMIPHVYSAKFTDGKLVEITKEGFA